MAAKGARYTLCTTYDAARSAAQQLYSSSTLILYCQGCDLGLPEGELSIIALGDPAACEVFLFDVLSLCDKYNPALVPLFSLLQTPDITKVVWDCRTYLLEMADTYGVLLQGVIDLQLAETSMRGKQEKSPRVQHTRRYFKNVADILGAGFSIPDDVHRLMGLSHCFHHFQLPGSDAYLPVTALYKKYGSAKWMLRPFPDDLQQQCVQNVRMITFLYARFRAKGKYLKEPEKLQEMTTRYMEAYPTRELQALHVSQDLYKFVPLEVITPSSTNTRRYKCARCKRMLALPSFCQPPDTGSGDDADEFLRQVTRCRLCSLLALRNSELKVDNTCPVASVSAQDVSAHNNVPYTFISTYDDAAAAAEVLARFPALILDCEGQNFGQLNGVLSIISIGSYPPSHTVYLFDVLALQDKHNPLLAPLFSLLQDSKVAKLVWDGRGDFLEILDTYGVAVEGILDMQLAEVMQRPTSLNSHSLAYFGKSEAVMQVIRSNPGVLDHVQRLMGLDHCAAILRVIDGQGGKDPAVTNLHRTDGGSAWLDRPLPDMLLLYAAHDIQLISRVAHVLLPRVHVQQLWEASARYMQVYPTRELKEAHVPLQLSKFVPLDVIDAPPPDAPRYSCARCERTLSLSCFGTRSAPPEVEGGQIALDQGLGPPVQRWAVCHLCVLIACRNLEAQMLSWGWTLL